MPTSPGQGGDITLRRVGAHSVTVTQGGVTKKAGFTNSSLAITISANTREIFVAEYGTTPADLEVTGEKFICKWTMVESSLKTLDIALGALHPLNFQNNAILSRGIGRSGIKRAQAGPNGGFGAEIVLHPLAEGSSTGRDVTIFNALITPTGDWELSDQGDMVIPVQAEAIINPAGTDGELLAIINEYNAGV
jgi:hypothetical protein